MVYSTFSFEFDINDDLAWTGNFLFPAGFLEKRESNNAAKPCFTCSDIDICQIL